VSPALRGTPLQKNHYFFKTTFKVNLDITAPPLPMTTLPIPEETTLIHKVIGAAIIWNESGQILIDRRLPGGSSGGLWEFPGGKLEPGETIEECVLREIKEELAIEIAIEQHFQTIDHYYKDLRVTLHFYHCRHLSGLPQPLESEEIRWVTLAEMDQFTFPTANQKVIDCLKALTS